jgi:hypothetical protein
MTYLREIFGFWQVPPSRRRQVSTIRTVFITILIALAGCESAHDKAERLQRDVLIAPLRVQVAQSALDSVTSARATQLRVPADSLITDSVVIRYRDAYLSAAADADVAQRNYNAFMAGR